MTDAPETIWATSDAAHVCLDEWVQGFWNYDEGANNGVSYTRTDLIPALEAAAYARGLEDAAKVAERNDRFVGNTRDVTARAIAAAIRALGAKP